MITHDSFEYGPRVFPLGTVLSVTDRDGRIFSPDGLKGIGDMLEYLVGEPVYTNQLPRVIAEVRNEIYRQHPYLRTDPEFAAPLEFGGFHKDYKDWLGYLSVYNGGDPLALLPLRPEDHTSISPTVEWVLQGGDPEGIIGIEASSPPEDEL